MSAVINVRESGSRRETDMEAGGCYIALDSPLEPDEVYQAHTPSSLIRPFMAPNIQGVMPVGSPPALTKSARFLRAALKCSDKY